jgi:MHS family proline/betaine transporter-like MFS transporter
MTGSPGTDAPGFGSSGSGSSGTGSSGTGSSGTGSSGSGTDAPAPSAAERRKVFWAATIGVSVEWYDYAVYGVLAPVIAERFFAPGDPTAALLGTFGIFALSFLVRPLGSMYFGSIGDRYGRRKVTAVVVLLMSFATGLIGVLPSYETLGVAAPVLLLVLRMAQGLSAGGEMGAPTMLYEYTPPRRRGLIFGAFNLSSYVSSLTALGLTAVLTGALGTEGMAEWGWRVPFLLAFPLGLVGLYLRTQVHESPVFRELSERGEVRSKPVRSMFAAQRRALVAYGAMIMINAVAFYVLNTYLPTYLSEEAGVPRTTALWASALISLTMIAIQPLYGMLSDRIGRKPVFLGAVVGLFFLSIPAFFVAGAGGFAAVYLGELLFVLAAAPTSALSAVVGLELFPPGVRYSGAAVGYNFAYAVFGGTAPYVSTWLLDATGSRLAPPAYIMAIAVVSFLVLLRVLPETAPRVTGRDELSAETGGKPA